MTDRTTNPATIPAEPPVRAFWWLKRLSLTGGALLLLLAITWVLWDQYSRREIQTRLAAYRAPGQPTTVAELQPHPVPDDQNAALLYMQAASAVNSQIYCPSANRYPFDRDLPYPPQWHTLTKRAIEVNSKPLALVRQASQHTSVDWGVQRSNPAIVLLPMLGPQRNLANLLGDAAEYEHFQGNDSQAVADARTLLHQAQTVGHYHVLTPKLVALGIEALATYRLQIMSGNLRIAQDAPAGQLPGEVSRDEIHAIITDLLSGRQDTLSTGHALLAERLTNFNAIDARFGSLCLLNPAFRLDAARFLDRRTALASACTLPTLPTARAALRPSSWIDMAVRGPLPAGAPYDPALQTRLLAATAQPDSLVCMLHRVICDQRMAAVMLASRMYVIDHDRYPQTLHELVPKYLPALPADPMAADGRPFGYVLAANGKRSILYSVGDDGIDQTKGRQANLPAHLLKGWQSTPNGQPDDQYRDLSSWINPEPRQPMTDKLTDEELGLKTHPDNPNQPDAPGNKDPGN